MSIIFKDEKLTPAEKRVLRASRSKSRKGAKSDPNFAGTRTGSVLGKAMAKLKRLRHAGEEVIESKIKAKKNEAKATAKPKADRSKASSSDAKAVRTRQKAEKRGNVRRGPR